MPSSFLNTLRFLLRSSGSSIEKIISCRRFIMLAIILVATATCCEMAPAQVAQPTSSAGEHFVSPETSARIKASVTADVKNFNEKKLEKLATQGDPIAAWAAGTSNLFSKNFGPAKVWLHKAIENGFDDPDEEGDVGHFYIEFNNYDEGLFWMRRACQGGDVYAEAALGNYYWTGTGVQQDRSEATVWYRKVLSNPVKAAYADGIAYIHLGDASQALTLLIPLAESGNVGSMQAIGEMYRDGEGVQRDPVKAQYWFNAKQNVFNELNQQQLEQMAQRDAAAQRPSAFSSIIDALAPLTANADPNGIQNAANQQTANISARQQQIQAQQEAIRKAAAQREAVQRQQATVIQPQSSFSYNPTTSAPTPVANSGTAPPPTCVDLGPGNCMPIAQYKQLQAQKLAAQQSAAANSGICPASGFIPGAMRQVANDASLGVQCVPGQPYSVSPTSANGGNGSGGYSSATVGGGTGCQDATRLVEVDSNWFQADIADKEVVAFVTNRSNSKVTCTIAFDGGGTWVDYETGSFNVGDTHKGGQGGGLWHMGAASSRVKYACYVGSDPTDTAGHSCIANLTFTYP